MRPFFLATLTLAFFFSCSVARADGVTVTLILPNPGWQQIAPNTFVSLESPDNINIGEPFAEFNFNAGLAISPNDAVPLVFSVLEPNGQPSDFISLFNLTIAGTTIGVLDFYSDPRLPNLLGITKGTLCTETASSGCIAALTTNTTNGSTITLTFAFDGESRPFDPFGAGFDTSDGLKVTTKGVPEPGNFALLASGLVGLAGMLRKKLLSR
jgi:hypothetical protein